jgi:hypothetical protein
MALVCTTVARFACKLEATTLNLISVHIQNAPHEASNKLGKNGDGLKSTLQNTQHATQSLYVSPSNIEMYKHKGNITGRHQILKCTD